MDSRREISVLVAICNAHPMLDWSARARFWEMNIAKTLKIPSVKETSFPRRIHQIKNVAFTFDPEKETHD